MNFKDYLQTYQPLLYQTFANAIANEKLAHAYLLSGESGIPLMETATFIAKSLVCDNPNPLACDNCPSCKRIDHKTYADFAVLDGRDGQIKKGDVQDIVGDFSKTAMESKGVMIYIINLVENMNVQAINSLLKFLEEPPAKTYAILTTENEAKVLPTIISRCEKLRMVLIPKDIVKEEAIANNVKEEDAELLVSFFNNSQILKEKSLDESYIRGKTVFLDLLDTFSRESEDILFQFENVVLPFILDAKKNGDFLTPQMFLDMLALAFKDAITFKEGQNISLNCYKEQISNMANSLKHLNESLTEILKVRNILNTNINSSLALMHLFLFITEVKI